MSRMRRESTDPSGRTQSHQDRFSPPIETLETRMLLTTVPAGFTESLVTGNLGSPTAMAVAPDGRVFVTTQGGDLRVVKNGALLPTAVLHLTVDSNGERGLLGVVFDPRFASNHFIYVYHTVPAAGSAAPFNEVSRFTVNGDVAVANSEVDILKLNDLSSATNHNGGAMHFGTDGLLYIDVGENASATNSQTLGNLLGKVLRIDVSNVQPGEPINNTAKLVPASNPFVNTATGINQAIYALGFRNPFTFAVQPGTGTIFINDVGQGAWEEIDQLASGGNYGWNNSEGFRQPGNQPTTIGTYHDPQLAYNHSGGPAGGGVAIVGGAFYNPPAGASNPFPASFIGKYFYQDLGHDWIRVFDPSQPGSLSNPDTSTGFATGTVNNPVDITMAPDGSLYYLARGSGGELLNISFTATSKPTIAGQPANATVTAGTAATFSVTASGAGGIGYQWQRNNGAAGAFLDIAGATSSTFTVPNAQASDNNALFRVVVSNGNGSATSNAATLLVTANHASVPAITVTGGLRNGKFDAGTPINFSLSATDQEDGSEPASRFTYQVDYVTSLNSTPGGVVRPFVPATANTASGSFTPATSGPYTLTDVLYRITFTVKDSSGLTSTTTQDVSPNTSTISLHTNPTGLQLDVDGQSKAAPTSFASVVGFQQLLDAPSSQSSGGTNYAFGSWSDTGAPSHDVTTPVVDTAYTATYNAIAGSNTAIDAGGAAAGAFVADTDFQGGGTNHVTNAIDTSGVTNPAPQEVYQSWRYGDFTYTVPGLTPGGSYHVRLDFSENVATAGGQRVFNVAINGAAVLSNFDIFAAAGGRFRAMKKDFTATADSRGSITLSFKGVKGPARINGITVSSAAQAAPTITRQPANTTVSTGTAATFSVTASGSGTLGYQWQRNNGTAGAFADIAGATSSSFTLTNSQPSDDNAQFRVVVSNGNGSVTSNAATLSVGAITTGPIVAIDAGGAAAGAFVADTDFQGGNANRVTNAIDTSGVANPAPQQVYQSWRYGDFTYKVPGLTPGGSYNVRLDFSENVATASGQRVFDVAINGATVLSNFDIFAAAGGRLRALEKDFTATADSQGSITLSFTGVAGPARINGITLSPAGKASSAAPALAALAPAVAALAAADTTPGDVAPPGTPPPTSPGNGNVSGVSLSTGGLVYYAKDALLAGFEWFARLKGYFPSVLHSSHSISPTRQVVDMAYANTGTMTFNNVVVPTTGTYTLTFRYAYASGLFPTLKDRPMGISANGDAVTSLTSPMHFPITGSFDNYQNASISVPLHAGQNSVQMFNIADAGVARVDTMTVTSDTASPTITGQPANAAVTAGTAAAFLVTAGGPGTLAYQWQRNNGTGGAFADVAGATSPSFTLTNVQPSDNNAQFRVVVSNGNGSVTSNAATLSIGATTTGPIVAIDAGGAAAGAFVADADFTGGSTNHTANAIDTSGVANPAPQAVYQSWRYGDSTYAVPGLTPGGSYNVRLDFSENVATAAGQRVFDVAINGATVLSNFDIFAAAGGRLRALEKDFTATADSQGRITLSFKGVTGSARINGITLSPIS